MKKIPLGGEVGAGLSIMVDDEDYGRLSKYNFVLFDCRRLKKPINYVCVQTCFKGNDGKWRTVGIQQLIISNVPKGFKIDHVDRNTLNNQRHNLRVVPDSASLHNRNPRGISKFRGIWWNKEKERWVAEIKKDGKKYWLGYFDDEIEAAHNYDYYARLIYAQHAALNFGELDYSNFTPKRLVKEVLKDRCIAT
jgi:hypothetical protein